MQVSSRVCRRYDREAAADTVAPPAPRLTRARQRVLSNGTTSGADRAGTPAYMSPEQLRGEDLTAAADVWALGVVLWELAAEAKPWAAAARGDEDEVPGGGARAEATEADVGEPVPDGGAVGLLVHAAAPPRSLQLADCCQGSRRRRARTARTAAVRPSHGQVTGTMVQQSFT